MTVIGFIGLGVMGEPMCRNMRLRGKFKVLCFDLNPAPMRRLHEHGIESGECVARICAESDVVFFSMPSGQIVADLARRPGGLLEGARAGQIFVDLGTSPVSLTRELADEFGKSGALYLDAPVARTRQAAEAGTLSVMVGGSRVTFEAIKPILASIANEITYCGPIGSGQLNKIMNNMVLFEIVAALSEARAIAEGLGFDSRLLFETLSKGSADSFALRNHGLKSMIPGEFPKNAFSVEYARKDLLYALELASEAGVDAEGAKLVERLFERAIAAGRGDEYHPVISRFLNPRA
jgi:3-hydroxyisobutyrate dehydrogenase-like beta-hydroxyacid dehydrogenase